MLDRIVEADSRSVVTAYERRVRDLEVEKAVTREKMASCGKPLAPFAETYRTALGFLANPWKLWRSERLEDRRAVLRLVFADRLQYARSEGYRTAKISTPFKLLGGFKMKKSEMVVEAVWCESVSPAKYSDNRLETGKTHKTKPLGVVLAYKLPSKNRALVSLFPRTQNRERFWHNRETLAGMQANHQVMQGMQR